MTLTANEVNPVRLLGLRPPQGVPTAYWLRFRWARAVVVSAIAISLLGLILLDGRGPNIAILFVPLTMLVLRSLIRRHGREFASQLRGDDYLRCLSCGYNLRGLPSEHTCPECGIGFVAKAVQDKWKCFLETG